MNIKFLLFTFSYLISLVWGLWDGTPDEPEDAYNFDSIRHLSSLIILRVYNNCGYAKMRDEFFPTGICKATKLERIEFYGFDFKNFPKRISDLTELSYLDLSNNKINVLPNRIGDLKNLKTLIMTNNEILSIPSRIGDLNKS